MMFRNIAVAISGGVDSAVSAYLLKQKGFNVVGVFMKNWDTSDEYGQCQGEQDALDADYTCRQLNIPLRQVDYVKDYWNSVFMNFLEDYQNGLTPNPDILCNRFIKFDLFYKYARECLNCDAIATGHYAKTNFGSYLEDYNPHKEIHLLIPKDTWKDQTFFLSAVRSNALRRTMFPLANYMKTEVKSLAEQCGLHRLCHKKESTGICFIGKRNFQQFIEEYIPANPGKFLDIDSHEVLGQHFGLHMWTIGQRCRFSSYSLPYYIAEKDVLNNLIYVAGGHEHPALYSRKILAKVINWLSSDPFQQVQQLEEFNCQFRFQHTKPLVNCSIYKDPNNGDDELTIVLEKPLRAITPGQYAVFYKDGECLGSARILRNLHSKLHKPIANKLMRNEN